MAAIAAAVVVDGARIDRAGSSGAGSQPLATAVPQNDDVAAAAAAAARATAADETPLERRLAHDSPDVERSAEWRSRDGADEGGRRSRKLSRRVDGTSSSRQDAEAGLTAQAKARKRGACE